MVYLRPAAPMDEEAEGADSYAYRRIHGRGAARLTPVEEQSCPRGVEGAGSRRSGKGLDPSTPERTPEMHHYEFLRGFGRAAR